MPDLLAGSPITALDTPPSPSSVQGTTITTTSTTFVATGADCAVTFTAPTTGRVKLITSARMTNAAANGTSGTLVAPETRLGSVVGSGTVVEAASDAIGPSHYGAAFSSITRTHLLTGLTPGAVYNSRLLIRTSNTLDTASVANRELIVEPAT
jgi:hypothetical protein